MCKQENDRLNSSGCANITAYEAQRFRQKSKCWQMLMHFSIWIKKTTKVLTSESLTKMKYH